jgi:hypothetical protein
MEEKTVAEIVAEEVKRWPNTLAKLAEAERTERENSPGDNENSTID